MRYIVDTSGKRNGVVLDMNEYQKLLEASGRIKPMPSNVREAFIHYGEELRKSGWTRHKALEALEKVRARRRKRRAR